MGISDTCSDNNFECGASITLIVLFANVCIMNFIFFTKTIKIHGKITYELVAILFAGIDAFCLVLYELFLKNVYTILIASFFELLIFSIMNFCFITAFFILVMGETFKSKILNGIFGCFWIMISVILITGLVGQPAYDCTNRFSFHWTFFTVCSLIFALNSLIFGFLLLKASKTIEKETERDSKAGVQQFYMQQRKILIWLIISFVIAIILMFAFDLELKNLLETTDEIYCEDSTTLVNDTTNAMVVSFLRGIAWFIPLLMLPVCIYVIPYVDERKWRSESTAVAFDNFNDNSFLTCGAGANNFLALNRDTVLFNKSRLGKSSLFPSMLGKDKPSFLVSETNTKK